MKKIKCPTCKKIFECPDKHPCRPFCCERCKLIDFGAWADERYHVPGAVVAQSDEPPANDE